MSLGNPDTIIHIDMDAFFASVEVLADPRLAGLPVVICGNPNERSVVSTASYEAREYGLHSGMPISQAKRLCPRGIFLRGDPEKYVYTSVRILNLLKEFTDRVEPFSIDEAFLDLTGGVGNSSPGEIGRRIKERVESRIGLTCSVGIGPNKLVAKMASSVNKPDGLAYVPAEKFLILFGPQPVSKLWGVGKKTESRLNHMGIRTVADLSVCPEPLLVRTFGVEGERLHHAANGIDDTPVIPYHRGIETKSMGHEHTLTRDEGDPDRLESVLLRLSDQVARRLRSHGVLARTVTLKVRYSDFRTFTRQRILGLFTDEERTIFGTVRALFRRNWRGDHIRLLGVSVSNLVRSNERPQSLMFIEDRRHRDLLEALDRVRDTFGENSLTRARLVEWR